MHVPSGCLRAIGISPKAVSGWFALLAAASPCAIVTPARATAAPSSTIFDIPAQNLAQALDGFARQAGIQLLYPYEAASTRRSLGLHGKMQPRAALYRLLKDSGLTIADISGRTITLRLAPPPVRRARPAKEAAPAAPKPRAAPGPPPSDIVVTGRAADAALRGPDLSYAVTEIGSDALSRNGPLPSTADLFKQIPGFWVEATGGEASNNVRSRGIPTDGYSSVALLEDGLPVQYDGGLAYLNTDQIVRVDSTIDRVEAVGGGPSAIFVPNAPGGSINFLTRNALIRPGYALSTTLGSFAYRRIDGFAGIRVTPQFGISVGGFFRRDDGLRDPGYPADSGGQIRAGVDYDDGAVRLSFNVKRLDDRVILYLPVPLQVDDAGRVRGIPGFDPLRDTLAGPDEVHAPLKTAAGPQDFDLSQGTHSRITVYTLTGKLTLSSRSALDIKTRLRTGSTLRNGLFGIGSPMSGSAYLASVWPQLAAAFPGSASAQIRYADSRQVFGPDSNGNGLVTGANLLSVRMPMTELMSDARLTRALDRWGHHDLALGLTYDDTRLDFDRSMSTALLEVRGQARRLDVVALDPAGRQTGALTDNGFVRYGSLFNAVRLHSSNLAVYAADEWKFAPRWRVDLGGRWERTRIGGGVEGSTSVNLGDPTTLADDAVLTGTGTVTPLRRAFSGFGGTIGINYHPVASTGFFLRFTRISRLPSATEFTASPNRTDEAVVPIDMAEGGIIVQHRRWTISAVGFGTHFTRLPFTDYRFDTVSSTYVERTSIANTSTIGLELSGHADLLGPLQLDVQATWQDPRYRDFRYVALSGYVPITYDVTGDQLIRVPKLAIRMTPSIHLDDGKWRIGMEFVHYSNRYADIANTQKLPAYSLINASMDARITGHVSLAVTATNLTNSLGLTEGNPRAGSFDTGGTDARYFLARPEFGRTIHVTLSISG
jgi:outer membrane receptor protein involved in Fe transport